VKGYILEEGLKSSSKEVTKKRKGSLRQKIKIFENKKLS
jgi:hypothetical protein